MTTSAFPGAYPQTVEWCRQNNVTTRKSSLRFGQGTGWICLTALGVDQTSHDSRLGSSPAAPTLLRQTAPSDLSRAIGEATRPPSAGRCLLGLEDRDGVPVGVLEPGRTADAR